MSLQEFSCRLIDENLPKFGSSIPRPPPPLDCLFYIQSFSFLILIQNSPNNEDNAGSFPLEMLLQSERYRYQYFTVKRCHHYATNICYRGVEMVRLDTSSVMIQCRRPNQRPIILCFDEQKRKNVCSTNDNKDNENGTTAATADDDNYCYSENTSPQIRSTMFAIRRLLEAFGQFELIPIELYRNYFANTVWDNIQLSFILLKKRFPPLYFINSSFHTGPDSSSLTTASGLQSSFDVTLEKIFKQLKADYLGNIRLMKYRMESYRRNRHLNLHRHSSTVDHQDQPSIDLGEDPKIILANYKQKFLRERENFLSRFWSSLFSR